MAQSPYPINPPPGGTTEHTDTAGLSGNQRSRVPSGEANPPKASRLWLILLIVITVLIAAVVGGFLVYYYAIAHRGTPYCQTYVEVADLTPQLAARLAGASDGGDFPEVVAVLGEMGDAFSRLRDADPPGDALTALDTMIPYVRELRESAETGGAEAYVNYIASSDVNFQETSDLLDTASTEYCS